MKIKKFLDPLEAIGIKRYPVVWLVNAVKIRTGRKSYMTYFGLCGKTKKIAFVGNSPLDTIIIRYVLTDEKGCDDEKVCLCIGLCPYNRTTFTSYRKSGIGGRLLRNKRQFENLVETVREIEKYLEESGVIDDIDFTKPRILHFKKPVLIIKREKKRRRV